MGLVLTEADLNKSASKTPDVKSNAQLSSSSSKPTAQPAIKEWDKTFQPVIEDLKLQDKFNYGSSKHIMRAVNGRYDGVMKQLKTEDPALYKKFQQFTTASKAFGQGLLTYQKTGDPSSINKNWMDATTLFNDIANKLDYGQGKKWAVDSDANVLTRTQFEKNDQSAHASNKSSTNARAIFDGDELLADYEKLGISPEYNKLKNINSVWQSEIKKKAVPIVSAWVSNSIQNIDSKNTSKADDNNNAWALNVDLLKHVSKYGTVSNSDIIEQDKKLAMSIRKQMWNKDLPGQLEVLRTNKDKLEGFSKRLGFYGSSKLLTTHEDKVGKNIKFYPNTTDKTNAQYANEDMDQISSMLGHYKEFKEIDTKFRSSAVELTKNNWAEVKDRSGLDLKKSQFDVVIDALVDKKGNISTYDKWKKSLSSVNDPDNNYYNPEGYTPIFGSTFGNKEKLKPVSALNQVYEQNNDRATEGEKVHSMYWIMGDSDEVRREERLKKIYNDVKRGYKLQFSNLKASQDYDQSLLLNGFGNDWNKTIKHVGIDLSVDKDLKLNSTTSKKQENVNKIIGLLKDEDGSFENTGVTLFGNKEVKEGLHAIQKDELSDYQKQNETTAKNFFKGDMSHVTMEFFRNTNIPGQVAYSFYNTKNKQKMVMYVPADKVSKDKGIGEELYVNTAKSALDFNFQAKGFKDMKVYKVNNKPAYQSARLTYDAEHDTYVGTMSYFDKDGNIQDYKHIIPSGQAMTVRGATETFNQFLSQYSKTLM
jgi:hypothetical protein